jgi:hypothetical protein
MEPVMVDNYNELDEQALPNEYELEDTEGLRQHNINLYYKVFRGAGMRGLVPGMTDALMLVNLYLKLGFVDLATGLIANLPDNPIILTHAAHIFCMNRQPRKALELLDRIGQDGPRERLIQAQALFDLSRLEESEATVKDMKLPNSIQLGDLRVKLAAELALPVETFLEREEALLDAKIQAML